MSEATSPNAPARRFIVVGVDGSEQSNEALRWAARQAELTGAELHAVTAWHVPAAAYAGETLVNTLDFAESGRATLDEAVEEVLGAHPTIEVSRQLREGPAAPTLLAAAQGAELLVVGSRGRGAFAGMLLGSVSSHCVTQATCPVVVVHAPHHPD